MIGCDDCGACGVQTVLDATLVCNSPVCNYFLVIEGYGGGEGEYNVIMNCEGDDPNLSIEGTIACNGAPAVGSTVGASSAAGGASGDHLWAFSLPAQTLVQFDSCASSYDTYLRVTSPDLTTELSGCDDCGDCGTHTVLDADLPAGDYILIIEGYASSEGDYSVQMNCPATSGEVTGFTDGDIACGDTVIGTTVEAGSHVGNGASDHIYAFSLGADQAGFVQFDSCESDFDTYLRVFNADLSDEITGCDDCGPCGLHTVLDAQLPAGDYNLVIEGFSSGEGSYNVHMICSGPGTDSDQGTIACDQTVSGSTEGASSALGNAGGEHLYSFTVEGAAEHNFLQFDSCESTYDTYLRIMSTDLGEERHGCDDCGDCGLQTVLDADLPPGDYVLVVEGFSSNEGTYSVTMNCDTHDLGDFEPIACAMGGVPVTGTTVGAEDNMGNPSGERLYAFTLSTDAAIQFDSCASTFDTFLRIASPALDQELTACDDCGDCGTHTVLDAELPAGDYVLIIEGYADQEGTYSVMMNCLETGEFLDGNVACGETVTGTTVGAGSHIGNGASDHVYDFHIDDDVRGVTFDSCGSEFDTYLRVLRGNEHTLLECTDVDNCAEEVTGCDDCGECGLQTVLVADPLIDPSTEALAPGDYLLIVEGFSSNEGVYTVTMDCRHEGDPPPPPPSGAVACDAGEYLVDAGEVDKTQGYGHGHDCNWHLSCSDPGASPLLIFTAFSTEANYDFVTIYDGDSNDAPQLGRFHGEDLPGGAQGIQSSGPNMLVRFTTDGSVTREGFLASFSCTTEPPPPTPPNACQGGLTLQEGASIELTAEAYDNSVICDWTLNCRFGAPTVTFTAFETEANFDFVRVYDGATNSDMRLANYAGNTVPAPVTGSGSIMLVEFTTDGSVTRNGFSAGYTCGAAAPPPPPDPCSGGLSLSTPGPIVNPDYDNSLACSWSLSCPLAGRPLLTFTSFNTETNFDWVSVYDGASETSSQLIRVSGDIVPDAVQATGQTMFVTFTTDASIVRQGFEADFTCPTGAIAPPGPPDACETGVTLVDGGVFSKTSYGHGHLCTWLLTCSNPAAAPLLSFSSFNTETNYDFVTAYNGEEASDAAIVGGPWSGTTIPDSVLAAGSTMLVEFTSDESVARDGFMASYSCSTGAAPVNACTNPTGVPMLDSGVIDQSMYFQENEDPATGVYTHNLDCRWLLSCSDRSNVPVLTFTSFNTEANFDFVNAYDGPEVSSPQLSPGSGRTAGWAGTALPPVTQGTRQQILLRFTTDGSVSRHGWSAAFACQQPGGGGGVRPPPPPPPPPPPAPSIEGVTVVSTDGIAGMTTVRLTVSLAPTQSNVYAMAGSVSHHMYFPPAYQVATPFGADIGGANPAFFAIANNAALGFAEFDSWLTMGVTDGSMPGAISASPGFTIAAWTESVPIDETNAAIFFMDPGTMGPNSGSDPVVMAQMTLSAEEAASGTATAYLQGRSSGGAEDWDYTATWVW